MLKILAFCLMSMGFAKEASNLPAFQNSDKDIGLISGARQITFVGTRSGEGYFSQDGQKMVFQSERSEKNPFYQIYLMDLKTGKTDLVSTGSGKTTCAWIHPDMNRVMFSSTHLDPELGQKVQQEYKSRSEAQKSKYSWSYDETFDIFEQNLKTKKYKRLTKEKGYDAEGAYSPDGKWIVFASNRLAYSETLPVDEKKIFDQDPSYMMDIYRMKADGTGVQQLTNVKGYDGGPFFSSDGSKITWRRFTANGQMAEIFVMNADGTGEKQATHLKSMSWAPYFHPSGDYLIFTSNILGYSNFELFIVDTDGTKPPVRVSFLDGFDGLPVFSPDGNQLSWTRRNEKGESQIYLAKWDDQKARKLLGLASKAPVLAELSSEIQVSDIEKWVSYLASEKLQGRATGSQEEKEYTLELSKHFKAMGLKPAGSQGYLDPFDFTASVTLGSQNKLNIDLGKEKKSFQVEKDFVPLSFSNTGEFKESDVVFAGYGIVAPATDTQPAYDSFKGLDVNGKWVLAFREIPEDIPNVRRIFLNTYSRIHHKALVARQRGALGLILVNGPKAFSKTLVKLKYEGGFADAGLPVLHISDDLGNQLVKGSGKTLKEWQEANDKGEIATAALGTVKVSASVDLKLAKGQGLNVIARLVVPGAKNSIVIGAHGDHLGTGLQGNSLAKNDERGRVHVGADDNASGVSVVMELAHKFSELQKQGKLKIKSNIVFAVWSGEEMGLLGSTQYLKTTKEKIKAYVNLDMVGRLRETLQVQGVGSANEWKGLLEQVATQTAQPLNQLDDPYVPSDGMAFYLKDIPFVMFFTGSHGEYHSPRDTPETLNYPGIQTVANVVEKLVVQTAGPQKITYRRVESSKKSMEGRSFRIYLGTIPDYSQEGVKGVKISGTSKDSPAEKAGLKAGDIIVELGQTKIENLYDYVYCLQAMKAGQPTNVKVQRSGQLVDLKILPTSKE